MKRTQQGSFWVGVQMAGLGLTFAPLAWERHFSSPALGCLALGGALGLWTLCHNRPGNFRIHPDPAPRARFVSSGPYRFIRHPMYASLLLSLVGIALIAAHPLAFAGVVVVALAVDRKATLEETLLAERFPAYAAYRQRTHRILPGLW